MKTGNVQLSGEQTQHLVELRKILAHSLEGQEERTVLPTTQYATCGATCLHACDGACFPACNGSCFPGCRGWCWVSM